MNLFWQGRVLHQVNTQTPLLIAVWSRDEVIVWLPLETGAQPDFTIEFGIFAGQSPMSFAEMRGLGAMAQLMKSYVQRE